MTRKDRQLWWALALDSCWGCIGPALVLLFLLLLAGAVGYFVGSGKWQ